MSIKNDRMLLHVCCGPCAAGSVPAYKQEKINFDALFCNPNIDSESEHQLRLENYMIYAKHTGINTDVLPYNPQPWHEAIGDAAGVFELVKGSQNYDQNLSLRKRRCWRCYEHRFAKLGEHAASHGYIWISSTLSISPYQFSDFIDLALEQAAQKYNVKNAYKDLRSNYQTSIQLSKDLGLYRQNYCGCQYSKEEANIERVVKKAKQ